MRPLQLVSRGLLFINSTNCQETFFLFLQKWKSSGLSCIRTDVQRHCIRLKSLQEQKINGIWECERNGSVKSDHAPYYLLIWIKADSQPLSFSRPCIKATKDLENYDKERHEEFKKYEMMKEHDRREHLKTLDDDDRKKEEEHYEEMRKKHADHPKVNHPVSLLQLHTQVRTWHTDVFCFSQWRETLCPTSCCKI